jgi:hypothetical protein
MIWQKMIALLQRDLSRDETLGWTGVVPATPIKDAVVQARHSTRRRLFEIDFPFLPSAPHPRE